MNKYKFLYLFWLLPAYFLFLTLQQAAVYYGLKSTYENGSSYIAKVVDFNIEQVAAQISGRATIQFQTAEKETVRKNLALPPEVTARISKANMISVRYEEGAFIEVVIMPTVELQKSFVLSNMAMAAVAFIITLFIAMSAHRKARKKSEEGEKKLIVERVD